MSFLRQSITQCGNEPVGWFEWCYVGFNWFEAVSWIVLACFLWGRFLRFRRSGLEVVYGLLVFVFGVTDVLEVYQLTVGLFVVKVVIFVGILVCRHFVLKQCAYSRFLL